MWRQRPIQEPMLSAESPSRTPSLTRVGAAFGALTGCLGASMIWLTQVEPGLEAGGGVLITVATGAALGWFGTECLVALTRGLGEVSE